MPVTISRVRRDGTRLVTVKGFYPEGPVRLVLRQVGPYFRLDGYPMSFSQLFEVRDFFEDKGPADFHRDPASRPDLFAPHDVVQTDLGRAALPDLCLCARALDDPIHHVQEVAA